MRILALETTERLGTVAAMDGHNLLAEIALEPSIRSAQSLAPGILAVLRQAGWQPDSVQLVAVSVGPGSFTGLRVGVTTAKLFAYAVGAEVLGVNTLEAIAAAALTVGETAPVTISKAATPFSADENRGSSPLTPLAAPNAAEDVVAIMDAQRGQLSIRRFRRAKDGRLEAVDAERLVDADVWLPELPPGVMVTGPALTKLAGKLPPESVVDPQYWAPRASVVARLAAEAYAAGRRDDIWQLVPHYSRKSAAEEKAGL